MSFKKFLILIFLLNLFFRPDAKAQLSIIQDLSDTYVNKLIDTAKKNYPRVRSYQNRINIANSNISKTKAGLLNAFTVSYIYQPGVNNGVDPANPTTSYFRGFQAGVFVNIGALVSQPSLIKQAREELIIAHNDQDEYFITLTTEVKKRYYMYIQRGAEVKLQTRSTLETESALKDAKYRFQKGELTFEDYNKMQIQYTEHQQTKIQAEANLFTAKADLEELLGTNLENIK
jgi:outer membrane protein TolC